MATAVKNSASPSTEPAPTAQTDGLLGAFDAVFRFLASLKLAVISLTTLATVLAYATFFEGWYGTAAVQEWIYRSKWFAVLLAFLGANILCAALIRYPWKKRQIGFLVTHTGLLVVLIGSWVSVVTTVDGQVGVVEEETSRELIRIDDARVYVRPLDKQTGEETREYQLAFYPGAFPWNLGGAAAPAATASAQQLRTTLDYAAGALAVACIGFLAYWIGGARARIRPLAGGAIAATLALGSMACFLSASSRNEGREDVLTLPSDPFKLVVKDYLPASAPPRLAPVAGSGGVPMIKAALLVKPPNAPNEIDALDDGGQDHERWLIASNPRVRRDSRDVMAALLAFQYLDTPDKVEDFLALPKDPLKDEVARIHYKDRSGKDRVFEWAVDGKEKTEVLPDSDISVTYAKRDVIPIGHGADPSGEMARAVGDAEIHVVQFQVKKGDGPVREHYGWGSLPMIPSLIPSQKDPHTGEIVRIAYYHPPDIGRQAMQGRASVIEIAGTPDGKLHYRALGRDGLRGKGPLKVGEKVKLAGGGPGAGMSAAFRVDEYLTSGVKREVCEPLVLPAGQQKEGIPACLAAMTVDGETREFWLRRSADLTQRFQTVSFPKGDYRVALDFDRVPLGFEVKLNDFDEGKDPGAMQSRSFKSEVALNDERNGVRDQAHSITMNHPLQYRSWTLYQSNYIPLMGPDRQPTGVYMSVFQTRYDPVWTITYGGCLLVVLGTFLQFYMRAGVFTDGGKREREKAMASAAKAEAARNGGLAPKPTDSASAAALDEDFDEL